MNKAKAKQHPQLSYDAVLIHGLMLVCGAGTVTAGCLLPQYSKEQDAALGVGVSAVVVFGLWSLVPAVRAWRKREPSRWPVVVIVLVIFEASCGVAFLASLSGYPLREWAHIILDFVPLFVPLFLLESLIAAPVALWRTRRAERKERANGGGPWSSRRRWKRWVAWYCPVAALVFTIILPVPLFVFCASSYRPDLRIRLWVEEHTPEAVGDASAWLLSCSDQPWVVKSYAAVLTTGRVSGDRLVAELDSREQSVASSAMWGLRSRHKEELLNVACMVAKGSRTLRNVENERAMGKGIGQLCDRAGRERYLDPKEYPCAPWAFLEGLLDDDGEKFAAYARNLKQYCDSKAPNREAALKRLARFAWWHEIEPLWAKYLADKDPERRKQAIASIAFIPNPNTSLSVLAAGLESTDQTLRRDLARNIQDILIMDYAHARREVLARVVKALVPYLDGPDITATQDSAWVLVTLIKARGLENRVRDTANWTASGGQEANAAASLTPEARKLIEDVRAAALQWLLE